MTSPGALAVTGAVFALLALVLAIASDDTYSHTRGLRLAAFGWTLAALAAVSFIGAAWWEALS